MSVVATFRRRDIDRAAVMAFVPVLAVLPLWALAMVPFWLVLRAATGIGYGGALLVYLAAGLVLVVPAVQRRLVSALMGARPPSASEAPRLQRAFDEVAQALHVRDRHFAVGVVDADDLNAFACGGHLVVVTSYAIRELDHRSLCGVLAHELCHHLGSHTVALTVQQWLMLPVSTLTWLGSTLRNVSVAAADTFGPDHAPSTSVAEWPLRCSTRCHGSSRSADRSAWFSPTWSAARPSSRPTVA